MALRNPDFPAQRSPRAPSREAWARLTAEERRRVADALPCEPQPGEFGAPPGDWHRHATEFAGDSLERYFRSRGRAAYVGRGLMVYYPDEPSIAPDVFVVLDVDPHWRDRWVTSAEGKGLDFALEVLRKGDPGKDLERNVEVYARLGIPEYFVLDLRKLQLHGWRLRDEASGRYRRLVPQGGRFRSEVLDLDLALDGDRVRFYAGSAALPDAAELAQRLEQAVQVTAELVRAAEERAQQEAARAEQEAAKAKHEAERAAQEAERATHEAERAAQEAERAAAAERRAEQEARRAAELQAELDRLRKPPGG